MMLRIMFEVEEQHRDRSPDKMNFITRFLEETGRHPARLRPDSSNGLLQ